MPSATLDPGAPLDNTMGALLLGLVFSGILCAWGSPHGSASPVYPSNLCIWTTDGISVLQTALYFTRYQRDPRYLKALVLATLLLDTLHMVLIIHVGAFPLFVSSSTLDGTDTDSYSLSLLDNQLLVSLDLPLYRLAPSNSQSYLLSTSYLPFSEAPALQIVVWSIAVEALPTGLTATLVQSFYAFRVYRISDKNIILTASILLLIGATSGCGIASQSPTPTTAFGVFRYVRSSTFPSLSIHTIIWLIYHWYLIDVQRLAVSINALSTSVDVIITTMLCFMLHRSQTKSLADETILNRLILITINTGLLTSLCAIAALIAIVYSPNTLIYAGFYFCIGRLYSNALLASLNARSVIRGRIRDVDSNFHGRSGTSYYDPRTGTRTNLTAPADIIAATELAMQIERETEIYEDGFYRSRSKAGIPEAQAQS
ncbi:hypothetical protein MSAN_00781400 [Mycena sanguinolenta]|uniref:DUF6534 domain-containing protein n=1 Tax=Mycena sanguinolenta TaxID=230812 RepID=A0A8H6Z5P4_9AGAR|nr:hypothetical protein MSAN_00781400 [Mycena sanguinolenta]